jgi:hypothetical protein
MAPHAGDALHRPDLRSHRAHARSVEEAPGPIWRAVAPEELEVLLEQGAPHAAQVVPQEIRQPHFLLLGEVLGPLQQQPPRLAQDGLALPGPELAGFLGTDLIATPRGRGTGCTSRLSSIGSRHFDLHASDNQPTENVHD